MALLALIGVGAAMIGVNLWASYHLRLARAALERYHTREAVPHLRDVLTIRSRDPEALLLASRAARRGGALDEADRYLDQYQEVRGPEDAALLLERVLVRVERGELDSVSNFCRAHIEQDDPATPLILEALARGYLRMYRPREAERSLEEWFRRQPDNPQALLIQGQVFDLETRHHDSIASYRRALTVDPEMEDARLRLCEALMQLGLMSEAEPHLKYLSERIPENLMVQVHLARARDRLGQSEEAEKIIDAVLARHPRYPPALAERGKLALRAGRADEAEKWLREAVALEPGDYQAHYQLSLCLEKNGKPDEAQKEQAQLQQIEEDIKRIQSISMGEMQQRPHDPDLHYQAGTIALRAGAVEEGLRWLHSALRENPNHVPSHKALMEYYQRIGDFRRARQHREKAGVQSNEKGN
jgi:tetratricopeptide (TPR) repeat protein